MTGKLVLTISNALAILAIVLAALACGDTVEVIEVVVTATPEATTTDDPSPVGYSLRPTTTAPPTATPQPTPKPTATLQPTLKPTATPRPTRKPTATPRPTRRPTATLRPPQTPRPRTSAIQTKQFTVEAGNRYFYTVRNANEGFINYEFESVKDIDPSEPLDIDFGITEQRGTIFQASNVASFIGSVQAQRDMEYLFLFDNTSSIFTGKTVTFRFNWSTDPSYPVSPYFGEYQETAECQELIAESQTSGVPSIERWLSVGMAAIGGDWIGLALSLFDLFLTNNQSDTSGGTESEKAGYAMTLWGCGIQ